MRARKQNEWEKKGTVQMGKRMKRDCSVCEPRVSVSEKEKSPYQLCAMIG
jgi:hypothetical protein